MKLVIVFSILLSSITLIGQSALEIQNKGNKYFNSIEINKIDTLSLWTFSVKYYEKKFDSLSQPIANIKFRRLEQCASYTSDSSNESYTIYMIPSISFDIYNISDYDYCKREMYKKLLSASCSYPAKGNDIIKVKNYLFFNPEMCISSYNFIDKYDYCRTTVYRLLSGLKHKEKSNLEFIINHIGKQIKESSD